MQLLIFVKSVSFLGKQLTASANLSIFAYRLITCLVMKKFTFILIIIFSTLGTAKAQQEEQSIQIETEREQMATYKEYGGFILDLTEALASPAVFPEFKLLNKSTDPYINWLERLNFDFSKVIYGKADASNFGFNNSWRYHGTSMYSGVDAPLNTASFRLNDNWRINTQGDYDADGYKRRIPSALPWEKNDFRGAFELKSSKGFSFRVEVQRKSNPYGMW